MARASPILDAMSPPAAVDARLWESLVRGAPGMPLERGTQQSRRAGAGQASRLSRVDREAADPAAMIREQGPELPPLHQGL